MTIARALLSLVLATAPIAAAAQSAPAQPAPSSAATPAPAPPACASPEHRQFDFWVGSWNVFVAGREQQVARSLIERLYDGCAIRENWMPARNSGGGSLSSWRPDTRVWRQVWVDNGNSYAEFEGRYENDEMVLTGRWPGAAGPGSNPMIRTHWSRLEGGGVRQRGEQSLDDGQTWTPAFDFTYRPAAG